MGQVKDYNPRLVWRLSLAQLISWGSIFYMFSLVLEPLERDLGLSRAQVSLAFSLGLLAEGLMAYPVGRWIDRGHERVVMTAGSVLAALCLLLHSRVNSLAGLYAVWLVCMRCGWAWVWRWRPCFIHPRSRWSRGAFRITFAAPSSPSLF